MSVQVVGVVNAMRKVSAMGARVVVESERAAHGGALIFEREEKERIRHNPHEIKYPRKVTGVGPGMVEDLIDSGNLLNGVQTRPIAGGFSVGPTAEYAPDLEFGTVDMDALPFAAPAYEAKKEEVRLFMAARLRAATIGFGK